MKLNNSKQLRLILPLLVTLFLSACATKKAAPLDSKVTTAVAESETKPEEAKKPDFVPDDMPYQPTEPKINDLIHTKLDVSFSWEKRHLFGEAELTLTPYFFDQNQVTLDAKGFDIQKIALIKEDSLLNLNYEYQDSIKLVIDLNRTYTKGEKYKIFIKYTAKPDELDLSDESSAISDDKGLYFINPDGTEDKPKQIWTQGETEASSCWFPTIDQPNEKTTEEISITVDTNFVTISNGELRAQVTNEDGTRTDYWVQDKPHAPYLFMMAVGEFAKIQDKWMAPLRDEELQVDYYVDKEYAQHAMKIFGNTPEMLGFFSKKLGYEYPWDKYSQVIVRDFVSGAMENTSASIFMEAVQITDRELLDKNWDYIIAHELFHHWFGDLVTAESWSNLALNESFANYSEYLWYEYKYGRDYADNHRQEELKGYLRQASKEQFPIIRYNYNHRMEMFDAHSYNKGGLVLHALRKHIGDKAFFASLKHYLHKNEFTDAEIHELRLSFEEVTGQDFNWFFDQWFLSPGHPDLKVTDTYSNGNLKVEVEQVQDSLYTPYFKIPTNIEVFVNGKKEKYPITIEGKSTEINISLASKPEYVLLDTEQSILGTISHDKEVSEYIAQYQNETAYQARYDAIEALVEEFANTNYILNQGEVQVVNGDTLVSEFFEDLKTKILNTFDLALKDPSEHIRVQVLQVLNGYDKEKEEELTNVYKKLSANDNSSSVRAAAIANLSALYNTEEPDNESKEIFKNALNDSSFVVLGEALLAYVTGELPGADQIVTKYRSSDKVDILKAVAKYYIIQEDSNQYEWTKSIFDNAKPGEKIDLIKTMADLTRISTSDNQQKLIEYYHNLGLVNESLYVRYSCYRILHALHKMENVNELRKDLIENEKSTFLVGIFDSWERSITPVSEDAKKSEK